MTIVPVTTCKLHAHNYIAKILGGRGPSGQLVSVSSNPSVCFSFLTLPKYLLFKKDCYHTFQILNVPKPVVASSMSIVCYCINMFRSGEIGVLYSKYGNDYQSILEKMLTAAIRNAATPLTLHQLRLERPLVTEILHNATKAKLRGEYLHRRGQ